VSRGHVPDARNVRPELNVTTEQRVLTPAAIAFLESLHREFDARRRELLALRQERQKRLDAGELPDFLPETAAIRSGDWRVAPIPPDLIDRRVEITGPVDRKMIINALNSGANVFMADFEDANSPTWSNVLEGQANLMDAIRREIGFTSPEGKTYQLQAKTAVLFIRPRGWHLTEKHFHVDGAEISGSLFDFGLYLFHNGRELLSRGSGPYFYLPKLESHLEARLWNDVFVFAQKQLGIPQGSIRATVLIETIVAAFEMDEILHELRDHSAGLNCGRWDYIFSFIKKFRNHPDRMLPDRAQVTMDRAFLKAYVELLIQTCHKRGIHAMGGMAAQIPIKNDAEANARALEKVRLDKLREVKAGHDGTWVAHPALVAVAAQVFEQPNQLGEMRGDVKIARDALLEIPPGQITREGLRLNIDVGIQYLAAWLKGSGAVPIYNLMEDAATAEICRAQVWQWSHYAAKLADGETVTTDLVRKMIQEIAPTGLASELFEKLVTADHFEDFLTLGAYQHL
jgi:malate synthase